MPVSIFDFIRSLKEQSINLHVKDGDKLEISFESDHIDAHVLEELKRRKQELIAFLKSHEEKEVLHIEQAPKSESYPLSNAQKRLWTLCQFPDANAAYNIPTFIYLSSDLNIGILNKAIRSTIERHEILRTCFEADENNEIRQWILPIEEVDFEIKVIEESYFQGDVNEGVKAYIEKDGKSPFDFTKAPLIRVVLFKEPGGEYIFYYNIHHIISDAWSAKIWIKNVLNFYFFYDDGAPLDLPELSIHYKDFAVWQQNRVESSGFSEHINYWKGLFEGEIPQLQLPISKQRPRVKTHNGALVHGLLDKEIDSKLEAFVAEKKGTMFMAFLTSICAILHRYSGQNELVIGTPTMGRSHRDLEDQIGFYLNTLALKTNVKEGDTFATLYERIKQNTLEAFEHDLVPFDDLVEALDVKPDTSRNPLFDVMLVFEASNTGFEDLSSLPKIDTQRGTSKFDLLFTAKKAGSELHFGIEYNTDLFEGKHLDQLMDHHEMLLKRMLASPDEPIQNLKYLSEEEELYLKEGLNQTKVKHEFDLVVPMFERQAEQTPNAPALIFKNTEYSYSQLNERINQLANYFKSILKEETETNIGVLLDRSAESVIAMMAIIKSGQCYVPIDPKYPQDRIQFIISDAAINHLVTETKYSQNQLEVENSISLDEFSFDEYSNVNPVIKNAPEHNAFIIYTSGSTGQPKGVIQTHRMLANLAQWNIGNGSIESGLRHLQYASFSFDVSLQDCWVALSSGSTLYVVEESMRLDFIALLNYLVKQGIETLVFPFSALTGLFASNRLKDFAGHAIKHIISSGEQLYVNNALKTFLEDNPQIKLHNHYGPSETHVVTNFTCSSEEGNLVQRPPIGKPIDNTIVRILDQKGNLVPPLFPGEIFLGGDNLANGYVNLNDLTKERFVLDPFDDNRKLYKTGDIGYWEDSGDIVYLGRNDDQVKIRGFRIELNEVTQALLSSPGVKDAVVFAEQEEETASLCAYIYSDDEIVFSELRSELKGKLPDYMVPSYFIRVDQIPLTSNGKVDKDLLPKPNDSHQLKSVYRAPKTDIEIQLAEIWNTLFKSEKTGLDDDFLERGGHSLKAVQLLGSYYKSFDVKIGLREIFERSTLSEHVALIQNAKRTVYSEIPQVIKSENYPLSNAQYRLWILEQFEEATAAYNLFEYVRISEKIDADSLNKSLQSLVAKFEVLRTVFKKNNEGEIRQWIVDHEVNLDYINLASDDDKEQKAKEYIERDSKKAFDLEKGPLIRMALIQMSENDAIIYYNMHHIISDGWSMEIFREEILAAYQRIEMNEILVESPLRIHYKDYTVWQRNEEIHTNSKAYWVDQFREPTKPIELPSEKKRPKVKTYKGQGIEAALNEQLAQNVKDSAQKNGGTPFVGLLTALSTLLYRYSHQDCFVVGMPVAGRVHPDLEKQLGFFVNLLPLKIEIEKGQSFNTLFNQVNQLCVDGLEHQSYPFDALVDELDLVRDYSRSPLFDILVDAKDKTSLKLEQDKINEAVKYHSNISSKYDLEISFGVYENAITLSVVFNEDVYDQDVITQFIEHYKVILESLLESPKASIESVNYLLDSEIEKLTEPKVKNPSPLEGLSVSEIFEKTVEKHPNLVATKFGKEQLTFKELNELSNQFADYLRREYAISKGDFVAIQIEKSPWQIVSILAILKTGAAYVPINENMPEKRTQYIIDDCNAKLKIDADLLDHFKNTQSQYSKENSDSENASKSAYVIYTSGTSGVPKGVEVSQEGLILKLQEEIDLLKLTEKDVSAMTTDYAFDVSLLEIFIPLLTGGCIAIPLLNEQMDFNQTLEFLIESDVTILHGTPSYFRNLFIEIPENIKENLNAQLKYLCIGGEALPISLFDDLNMKFPNVTINNHYGPTEAIIHAVCNFDIQEYTFNNIGLPLGNTSCYILDELKNPVANGVIGELHIGGPCLAKGYLNSEKQTQKAFIDSPFVKGEKIYSSGDLVRKHSSGNIEYLGRKDNQVKVRGYRIECGDIENRIDTYEGIQSSIVIKSQIDEDELVAYVVAEETIPSKELRDYLKTYLPTYMVPKFIVEIDEIPTNSNGKVQYDLLPSYLESSQEEIGTEFQEPTSDLEMKISEIWKDLLRVERVGINDDFFELGGNSIRMMKMFGKLNATIKTEFSIKNFFASPTITQLVKSHLEQDSASNNENELIKLTRLSSVDNASNIVFMHDISGRFYGYSSLINHLKEKYTCYGFELEMSVSYSKPVTLVEFTREYAQKIIDEIEGPIYLIGWSIGGTMAHALSQNLTKMGLNTEGLVLLDSHLNTSHDQSSNTDFEEAWYQKTFSELSKDKTELINLLKQYYPLFFKTYPNAKEESLPVLLKKLNTYQFIDRTSRNYEIKELPSRMLYVAAKNADPNVAQAWEKGSSNKPIFKQVASEHYEMLTHENVNQIINNVDEFIYELKPLNRTK